MGTTASGLLCKQQRSKEALDRDPVPTPEMTRLLRGTATEQEVYVKRLKKLIRRRREANNLITPQLDDPLSVQFYSPKNVRITQTFVEDHNGVVTVFHFSDRRAGRDCIRWSCCDCRSLDKHRPHIFSCLDLRRSKESADLVVQAPLPVLEIAEQTPSVAVSSVANEDD